MERRPVGDGMGGEKAGGSAQAWVAYPPNMHQQPEWLDIPESPPLRFTHSQNARLLQGDMLRSPTLRRKLQPGTAWSCGACLKTHGRPICRTVSYVSKPLTSDS